ncbi:uncharacterized protein [Triticum aestivum]|uniref:uncharacterized protein isoform X2 n=1 Tax=Triticum aestivum TaxID=4565 RepID=UPI001D010ACC|nr:uncharacterized protein LOC123086791 isoform X2 [Triticum aestivum]
MLIILLAVFAIVASAIALQGAVCFHSRAESIKDIVGRTALEATATIYNITGAIERMQNISKLYNISSQSFDHLNSTVKALNSEAVEIQAKAEKNMRLVSKGINTLELVIILTVTLNLVVVLVLLVGRPLRLQKLYYMCIALCWVLLRTVLLPRQVRRRHVRGPRGVPAEPQEQHAGRHHTLQREDVRQHHPARCWCRHTRHHRPGTPKVTKEKETVPSMIFLIDAILCLSCLSFFLQFLP